MKIVVFLKNQSLKSAFKYPITFANIIVLRKAKTVVTTSI